MRKMVAIITLLCVCICGISFEALEVEVKASAYYSQGNSEITKLETIDASESIIFQFHIWWTTNKTVFDDGANVLGFGSYSYCTETYSGWKNANAIAVTLKNSANVAITTTDVGQGNALSEYTLWNGVAKGDADKYSRVILPYSADESDPDTVKIWMAPAETDVQPYIKSIEFLKLDSGDVCVGDYGLYRDYDSFNEEIMASGTLVAGNYSAVMDDFCNLSDIARTVNLVNALYIDGKLDRIAIESEDINPGEAIMEPLTATLENVPDCDGNIELKSFVFDKNLVPMKYTISLKSAAYQSDIPRYRDIYRSEDEEEVKILFDTKFNVFLNKRNIRGVASSWDYNAIGGSIVGQNGLYMTDTSDKMPTYIKREIEPVKSGPVDMTLRINLDVGAVEGFYVQLTSGGEKVVHLEIKDGSLVMEGDEDTVLVKNVTAGWYITRIRIDVTEQIVTDLAINGTTLVTSVPFIKKVSHIDEVKLGTQNESVGSYRISRASMYKGYHVREFIEYEDSVIPKDWRVVKGSAELKDYTICTKETGTLIRKRFDKESRDTVTGFYIMPPETGGGFAVGLNDGTKNIFEVSTTEKGFAYRAGDSASKEFYTRMKGVMYHFYVKTYYEKHTADLYINNRLVEKDIPIPTDITGANSMTLSQPGDYSAGAVGMEVYPNIQYDDYVPEPIVPEKESDIEIIMQMCPMWSEGMHNGYEHLLQAPNRAPLIGYYDESSPEASDWNIKHMVEHGIDVRESTWYKTSGGRDAVREYAMMGSYKAFQNAKYADMLPWFIKFENGAGIGSSDPATCLKYLLESVAPFWIEYYFKDPNYYKINGRPVVGFYSSNLSLVFGSDIATGVEKFRKLCVENGVNSPLLLGDFGAESMEAMGFNIQSAYHRGEAYPEEAIELNIRDRDLVKGTNIQAMPTVNPGFDAYAWQLGTGTHHSVELVKTSLEAIRDRYYDGTENNILGKKLLRLATWDEYAEGHYFAPSKGEGFGYLDAVYDTFVGETAHKDILPTNKQKDRIVNRYAAWRQPFVHYEKEYSYEIPKNAEELISWEFDEISDNFAVTGATSEIVDGHLVITATTSTPTLEFNVNEAVEASDITHMKIRIKNNSNSHEIAMQYITSIWETYSDYRKLREHMYAKKAEYQEIVFPVEKYSEIDWRGELEKIRAVIKPFNVGETAEIDSIVFYGCKPAESLMKLEANGYTQYVDGITDGGEAYVPIQKAAWSMLFDDDVFFDEISETVMYKSESDGKVVLIPKSGDTFALNDAEYSKDGFVKFVGDECYVSTRWAQLVYEKVAVYDENTNTFRIKNISVVDGEMPYYERTLLYEDGFNGTSEGFVAQGGMLVTEGAEAVNLNGGTNKDPIFVNWWYNDRRLKCDDIKVMAIRLKASSAMNLGVFWTNENYSNFNISLSLSIPLQPTDDYVVHTVNLEENKNWVGELTRLRLDLEDFENNGYIDIDWIRWYGDFEE